MQKKMEKTSKLTGSHKLQYSELDCSICISHFSVQRKKICSPMKWCRWHLNDKLICSEAFWKILHYRWNCVCVCCCLGNVAQADPSCVIIMSWWRLTMMIQMGKWITTNLNRTIAHIFSLKNANTGRCSTSTDNYFAQWNNYIFVPQGRTIVCKYVNYFCCHTCIGVRY